jgi:hypothetical protein
VPDYRVRIDFESAGVGRFDVIIDARSQVGEETRVRVVMPALQRESGFMALSGVTTLKCFTVMAAVEFSPALHWRRNWMR